MKSIIEVTEITKKFANQVVLNQASFSLDLGMIFGFLGPSGAGKTTTINILTNQIKQYEGEAKIFHKECRSVNYEDLKKIGIMSETVGFYEKLSVYKNLEFFARFHSIPMKEVDELLRRLDLYKDRKKKVEKLSTGMKQRLMLIRAVLHHPQILFLDEPTSGMDPTLSKKVHELLIELKNQDTAIFLTTHDMDEAMKLCDKLALLHQGKILEYGSPQSIIDKYSNDNQIEIQYKDGRKCLINQKKLKDYLSKDIKRINSFEPSLENIFIYLTKEDASGKS